MPADVKHVFVTLETEEAVARLTPDLRPATRGG